jgi:hypothetical protein
MFHIGSMVILLFVCGSEIVLMIDRSHLLCHGTPKFCWPYEMSLCMHVSFHIKVKLSSQAQHLNLGLGFGYPKFRVGFTTKVT